MASCELIAMVDLGTPPPDGCCGAPCCGGPCCGGRCWGGGCCPYPGSLPRWAVFAKRLDAGAKSAAAIAINFGNESLPAGMIRLGLEQLFGSPGAAGLAAERDVWRKADVPVDAVAPVGWVVGELAPRSSYFALLKR